MYITFIYSRKRLLKPVNPAITMHERCLRKRDARNEPAIMAVSPVEPLKRVSSTRPVTSSDVDAKRLIFSTEKIFLNIGGQVNTSDVPTGMFSSFLRKLIDESPVITVLRPNSVSRVIIRKESESRMKLMALFTGPEALGMPSTRFSPEI